MTSKTFIKKFLERLDRVDQDQLELFLKDLAGEIDLFHALLDQANEGILIFNNRQEVEFANLRAIEILRYEKKKDIINRSLDDVIYNKDLRKYLKYKIGEEESIKAEEHVMGMPLVRVMRINFYPVRNSENLIDYYYFSFTDITRQKLEELKNRRQESISSMGHLAAGLAHEIKNPLASVDIHLKLLKRYLDAASDFENKKDLSDSLKVVQEELNRLNSIVQDFLSSIRPISLDLEKLSLKALFTELLGFLALEFKSKKIEVQFLPEDNLPPVLADSKYLRMVFLNLLKNAMEALEEVSENRNIIIKITENFPVIEILVKDSGKGIETGKLDKIFDPYFTTKSYGTGIGLTLVHKIITEHGGNIKVESREGSGAEFTVMLPQYRGETKKYLDAGINL